MAVSVQRAGELTPVRRRDRQYNGDLHVADDFSSDVDDEWTRYNTIIDGDLTVDENVI